MDWKVKAHMSLAILGAMLIMLLVLAPLFGTDSRDGNDWMHHSSAPKRR